jgi:hypothetical protein
VYINIIGEQMKYAAKELITPFDPSAGRVDKKVPLITVARMMQQRIDPVQKDKFDYKKHLHFAWVPASLLYINYDRQRWGIPKQVDKLSKKWDINCVTPLQCRYSAKENRYYGADGQQHTIAWILKYGSIWHRYKKYIETNVDILDSVWQPFNYVKNFDPVTEDINKTYSFDAGGNVGIVDMVLQKTVVIGPETSDTINVGFYPKIINDFNVFFL